VRRIASRPVPQGANCGTMSPLWSTGRVRDEPADAARQRGHASCTYSIGPRRSATVRTQASDRLTDAAAEDWYRRLVDDPFCWIIEAGGRAVGAVRVHHQSEKDRNTRVGIGIFDRAWRGKGLGTEALRLFLGHAFGELGLHRVELHVLEHNAAARRSYVKAGFTEEGTARDSAWIGGRFCSHVRMSILENEYRAMERKPPE